MRESNLDILLGFAEAAIAHKADVTASRVAERVFGRLREREGTVTVGEAGRLPVCDHHLEAVYSAMAAGPSPLPELASAFAAIEGDLRWARRKGASPENQPFYDGHANAMLIGPGGIEQREDVMLGVSLMAPNILYPDHSHPPEEVYLAFTDGEWWNAGMAWTSPGPGGLIYNPPGILHAMRSGAKPFLALWLLPVD